MHFWPTLVGMLGPSRDALIAWTGCHAGSRLRGPVRRLNPLILLLVLLGAAQLVFLYNMVVSWALRPARRGQPVAGEDDRVADLFTSCLQLR